ncbi:MAG: TonB-dependent receptor plug domain-containing protein [Bacteroidales bacterium]|nr:TonB-dependent receptor plug domain-containing protein [Bacteroidales bacterium]
MKKSFVFLFLLFFYSIGYAQLNTSKEQDQNNFNTPIAERFNSDSLTLIEKVYLHTDRTYYFPGEDIWFKAYLIDASNLFLSDHSNNLHVEIISPASKIIGSRTIKLEGGLGNGDFRLPADLISGRYRIRAYTNYMRNFGDQFYFSKEITLINSNDEKDRISDDVKYVENNIHVSFFPEGGSLVDNVPSIVAFKATNNLGNGCDITGRIYSSNGNLITTFRSTYLGMGSFLLRPISGLSYYSVIKGADSIEVRTELPKSFSDGVTLSASINQNNELLITTRSDPQTFQLKSEHDLLLRFSIRKELIKTVVCKVKAPTTNFILPTIDLPDGVLMLTLSTLDNTPLAERLIYIQRVDPVTLQIETDKLIYNKRERVSLNILMPGDSSYTINGNISLAVVNSNLIDSTSRFPSNISSWFLLESDVHGPVEDPSYYFDPSNTDRFRNMDLLLLTQGWRDFTWKYENTYFPPENGFTISGRLRKTYINKPIQNSRVSIGIFGSTGSFLETVPVDSSGRFSLSGIDFTGDARLIVTGIGEKDRFKGEIYLDSVLYFPAKVTDSLNQISVIIENKWIYLRTYFEINESVRKQYKLSDTINLGEVKIIAERHKDPQTVKIQSSREKYDNPDSELIITQQMQSYPYLIEILRGHVAGVVVEGSYPDYRVLIRGFGSVSAQGQPLVLIDGNEASFEDLIHMPISNIDRIDVLKSYATTSIFGFRGSSGVFNLITRAGGSAYVPVRYSINARIMGYSSSRIFYSPQHLSDSDSAFGPDLRSTLLWEPDIDLESNKKVTLNYYNGDNSSVIRAIAEGITLNGVPITGKADYEVR